jgi:hypothetical protein
VCEICEVCNLLLAGINHGLAEDAKANGNKMVWERCDCAACETKKKNLAEHQKAMKKKRDSGTGMTVDECVSLLQKAWVIAGEIDAAN